MYIDTSCLAAYYLPELHSKRVQEVIQSAGDVYVSHLTDLEFLSAIKKKQRMKEMDAVLSDQVYLLYSEHRNNGLYRLADLTPKVFKASEILLQTTKTSLRTLDAIHLGVAYEYKLKLFSFDDVMLKAANECNIKTLDY